MSNELIKARQVLSQAIPEVREELGSLINNSHFYDQIDLAFGSTRIPGIDARDVISQWLEDEDGLSRIEIVDRLDLNGAQGAYGRETQTIYLAQEFLIENQDNLDAVSRVILEELGHAFSEEINPQDAPGDEGAIFSWLVRGEEISPETLAWLREEDDHAVITLDNQTIAIEQAREGENPAFDLIGLTDLRNDPDFADIDGTGFDVVVIDSGLDITHPLLDDNYQFGFDYVNLDDNPNDLVNHGTHVSGIIGAEDENIGVAPDVGLIALKVGDSRQLDNFAINDALQAVLDEVRDPDTETNIVAVNLSFGGGFFTDSDQPNSLVENQRRRLIDDLEEEGVVVVAAAGNNYEGKPDSNGDVLDALGNLIQPNQQPNLSSPAIYSTISVGAVWQDDQDPFNSFRGSQVPGEDRVGVFSQRLDADNFLFAPGIFINSTVPESSNGELLAQQTGTSQASPHVAGSVALLQEVAAEYDVRLSAEQVRDYLIDHADIITDGDDERDNTQNTDTDYPRINLYQSAIALREDLENDDLPATTEIVSIENVPNDLIDGAIEVTLGNDLEPLIFPAAIGGRENNTQGNPTTADVDLFRLTLPDNGVLEIDIDTPFDTFPDSYIRLFNEEGEELFFTSNSLVAASDDDLAPGETTAIFDSEDIQVVLNDGATTRLVDGSRNQNGYQPGNYGHLTDSYLSFNGERGETYYIGVSDFSNREYDPTTLRNRPAPRASGEGQYELIATFINSDTDGSIAQITDDTALPITSLSASIGSDGTREIGNKDVDFYRLNSNRAGILEIDIDSITEDSITDPVDSVIVLFDENGNQLGFNDDTDTTDAQLRFRVTPNQDYYVAVTGFGNQNFNPFATGSGAGGDIGEYVLNSRLLSLSAAEDISNNSINSGLVLEVSTGETITGRIGEDGGYIIGGTDVDIYRFVAESDQTIEIRVDASREFTADTFLRFFDGAGEEIAQNDDENSLTRGSLVEVEVEAEEEYYIGINGSSENADNYDPLTGAGAVTGSQGDYTLAIGNIPSLSQTTTTNQFSSISDEPWENNLPIYSFAPNELAIVTSTSIVEEDPLLGLHSSELELAGVGDLSVEGFF